METKRRPWLKIAGIIALVILVLALVGVAGFVIWGNTAAAPMPEAIAALESDGNVNVTQDPWITFAPVGVTPTTGFIFYPGGRVDPRAYAPGARAIAEAGYLVVIPPMPLNLAVFAPDRANDVIAAHPEIQNWYVGGHSLGGTMAAAYADTHPDQVDGLIFWASYPANSNNLSDQPELAVTSIYGTLDGLATPEKVLGAAPLLPSTAQFVPIEGGNHAQFGYYGPQSGDNPATITREEQQAQAVNATLATLALSQ